MLKGFLLYLIKWDHILCTIFIFALIALFQIVELPKTDLIDPVGKTFEDFDATDVVFSKIRKYKNSDSKFAINDEKSDTNLVIINFGERTRGEIAEMLKIVNSYEPAVIGVDAFFKKPKSSEDSLENLILQKEDSALSAVCQRIENLVFVSKLLFDDTSTQFKGIQKSHAMFSDYVETGYANLITAGTEEEQKTCRTFDPQEMVNGKKEIAFPVKLVSYLDKSISDQFLARNYEVERINYLGNITEKEGVKFTVLDHDQILNHEFDPSIFKNKIVLFGFTGRYLGEVTLEDIFYTPMNEKYVGKAYPDMYGIVIHANIIHMILTKSYIDVMPEWIGILIGILVCYISVILLGLVFEKFPLLYGTLGKIVQLGITFILLFISIRTMYYYNYRVDFGPAIVTVLLAGDLLEIYMEVIKNGFLKIRRFILLKGRKANNLKKNP